MSFLLQAPMPTLTTTSELPNPKFDDSVAGRTKVDIKYSMNGTKRSFVQSNDRGKLQFTFLLSRMKALELRAFVQAYYRAQLRITTHRGEVWHVYFAANPFEFTSDAKAGGWPGDESTSVTLVFEGTRQLSVPSGDC
jgi:hypothetical protein